MPARRAWILLAIVVAMGVCTLSIRIVPFGQGPFTAVYGPAGAFVAWRAALRVMYGIRTALLTAVLTAPVVSPQAGRSAIPADSARAMPRSLFPVFSLLC